MTPGDAPASSPYRARLANLTALPLLPTTIDTLLRSIDSPRDDALAACAHRDPALLAHLLRRRAAMAPAAQLAAALTTHDALAELAAPFAAGMIADGHAFDGGPGDAGAGVLWPRAVRTACLAEALAGLGGSPGDAQTAHMLGLLLDLGGLALYRLDPAAHGPILRQHGGSLAALLEAERVHFGMTHSLAGRIVADAWELPAAVRRYIWFQYQPRPAPPDAAAGTIIGEAVHWARRIVWGLHEDDYAGPARALSATPAALRESIEAAEDRASALMHAAPPQPAEPDAFRARLSAYIATASRSTTQEELEWAEQVLMAGETEAPAASSPRPAPSSIPDTAARMAKALKAPIARITEHANRLLTRPGDADPALLRTIHEQGLLAERLLLDVIACTQPVELRHEPVLLNYFLQQFFRGIADRLRQHGIRIELDLAEGLPRVPLDRAAIEQVLLNLTVNAIEAMGELGGVLTVSTRADGNQRVTVALSDTGRGIDPAIADTAFEPLVKGAESGHGPGLGLAAVRALISAHGGAVSLAAGPDGGSTCAFNLPVTGAAKPVEAPPSRPAPAFKPRPEATPAPVKERPILKVVDVQAPPPTPAAPEPLPAADKPEAPAMPAPPRPAASQEPDPKRLLVADSDFELGELLQELLGRRGYEVAYHRDPAQAVAEAGKGEPFGQLLVEASLFAPDGRALCQVLHEAQPTARIILTETPGATASGAVEGLHALRLSKPFPVRALLSALQPQSSMRIP